MTYRTAAAEAFLKGFYYTVEDGVVEVADDGTLGLFAFKLGDKRIVATPDNQGTGPYYSTYSLRLTRPPGATP